MKQTTTRRLFTVEPIALSSAVTVINNKTGQRIALLPQEFTYGSMMFNDITDSFPNYVHGLVWAISDARRAAAHKQDRDDLEEN